MINKQFHLFQNDGSVSNITDSILEILLILNKQRRIVYANQRLFDLLGSSYSGNVLGKQLGELLSCIHSNESEGGCGTTEFCRECGAVNSILESQKGTQSVNECRIHRNDGNAFDLKVCATPYQHNGDQFTVFALSDISDEKRRQMLERTFFHDVLNTAGCVLGFSDLLSDNFGKKDNQEITKLISQSSNQLIEEIQSQSILLSAERGEFEPSYIKINSLSIIKNISELYSKLELAEGKSIITDDSSINVDFYSDKVLIGRIIGNMLKNALEASIPGETVTILCSRKKDNILFSVNNKTYMPRNVQLQVFQGSFSTKGSGRGIGTCSIKLFAEKYLAGNVSFITTKSTGTTFNVSIPFLSENPE